MFVTDFILHSILKSFVILILESIVVLIRLARVLLKLHYVGYYYSFLFEVLQGTYYHTFFVNIVIDYIDSLFESLLRKKEVNSNLFSSNYNNSLGILIFNIVSYEGLNLSKY